MHAAGLILTLTTGLTVALVFGYITQRLSLSPIVGYLIAGLIIGPYTPGFIADHAVADQFAEIGIVLLMFGVGLHFHVGDLMAVRNVAITGALVQSTIATLLGYFAGRMFGWPSGASLVFGIALSVASTAMLTRVLVDNHDLQTTAGRIAIGWLIMEDLITIVVLVLLPAVFAGSSTQSSLSVAIVTMLAKLTLLVLFAIIAGKIVPKILGSVAATRSRELFTLSILVLALGIAVESSLAFGVSMALGAFLAGMIVGQSEFSFRAASDALPMRDAFSVLFFVSIGMLFDPKALAGAPVLWVLTLAIVLVGKPLAALAIVSLLGYSSKIAIGIAVALAQIGEFSLILARLGDQLKILPPETTNLIVAASIVSLALNPILYRRIGRWEAAFARVPAVWNILNRKSRPSSSKDEATVSSIYRAVVVGYGPIGQTVARLLQERNIEPVIIDVNLESTRRARSEGYRVVYGDATRPDVLDVAGIRQASALVISGPPSEQAIEIIRLARNMNPNVRVLSRSEYLKQTAVMRRAGADMVFSGEGETALAMTEYILEFLGATPQEMNSERERLREEILRITGT
jgi:CPA2 family monovalent cation:H+ antiporter-2